MKSLPETVIDEIAARTDGVPLYIEEMTKAVLESGLLRETVDAWLLDAPIAQLAIPNSLHDSLMARLDRLKLIKEVAQTAAVIGRSLHHRTIAALSSLPEAELTAAMNRLVEAELVFRRGQAPDVNLLVQTRACPRRRRMRACVKSRRQTLHARLFDILKQRGDAPPEILAQHAEAAGWRKPPSIAGKRRAVKPSGAQPTKRPLRISRRRSAFAARWTATRCGGGAKLTCKSSSVRRYSPTLVTRHRRLCPRSNARANWLKD